MTMIIFIFYNIYFLHACFILYNLPIFVLHNIVFNVLSDNKNSCYKLLLHYFTLGDKYIMVSGRCIHMYLEV